MTRTPRHTARTGSLHPAGYPWTGPARTGVLTPTGLRARRPEDLELAGRVPVLAVGSNASPAVLVGKLGGHLRRGLPMVRALARGLGIGHSAHASAGGYLAAAPFAAGPERATPLVVTWLDRGQLRRVDATEPNYRRRPLPSGTCCRVEDGTFLTDAQLYDSRHGVLAQAGQRLPLAPQHRVVAWLAGRLPDPHATALAGCDPHGWLGRPDTRHQLPGLLRAGRLTRRSGLA